MLQLSKFLDLFLILASAYIVKHVLAARRRAPLPPGPRGLPWLGNVMQWPQEQEWVTFTRWSQKYGDIIYTKLYGRSFVIINSARVVFDMLDRKGALYSDRATRPMLELSDVDQGVAQVPYGDRHRKLRTLILKTLGTKATVSGFSSVFETNWNRCLRRIVENDRRLLHHIHTTTGSIILRINYGYDVKEGSDPLIKAAQDSVSMAALLIAPKAFLVDTFPILKGIPCWFPGAKFRRIAQEVKEKLAHQRALPHSWVCEQMAAGTAQPSFTVNHLEDPDLTPAKEDLIRWASNSIFAAGFDTTASSVYSLYLAMVLYPDVQKQAQGEIDRVIGQDRLPTLADWDSLPYVGAIVKEVLRWHPVTPQGLPHRLMEDDIQDGYFIPKGTIVIPNVWKILRDPDTYAQPTKFNPGRFLGDYPERDPTDFCFGFGRRICPGLMLAQASIFVACAMTLAVFDIRKAKDAKGCDIDPQEEYSSGLLSHASEFPCSIVPRSSKAAALATSVDFVGE